MAAARDGSPLRSIGGGFAETGSEPHSRAGSVERLGRSLPSAADASPAGASPAGASPAGASVGLPDLEAAIALVQSGAATRIVLAGFPSWPGLLWQAYELARDSNVLILPTVVHQGGAVDIVVARDEGPAVEPQPPSVRG